MSLSPDRAVEVQRVGLGPLWVLWVSAAGLAALGTAVLYAALPGINWAISVVTVALVVTSFWTSTGKTFQFGVVLPLALACLIASGAALTADPTYELLIAAATLFALGSAVLAAYTNTNPAVGSITSVLATPYAAILVTNEARRHFAETSAAIRAGRGIPAIRGVALALPVTLLLALLLSEADPTFAAVRDFISTAFLDLSILPRGIFFCVLTGCLVGAFGIASHAALGEQKPPASDQATRALCGDTERIIVTGSMATLYALFLVLQVSYLFGDPGGRSGSGVSYADAVHRGFVELNVASSVCGVVLFALRRYAFPSQRERSIRVLEWIVVVQAQVLLVSAFYRVNLYESAYGFTRLRLYVQAYAVIAFLALVFLLIELRAYPIADRLLRRVLVVVALAFGGLTWVNSDAWIAHENLLRYTRTGHLDVPYLTNGLGPDAVPEVMGSLPQLPAPVATRIRECLEDRYRDHPNAALRWFEWSLRRAALNRALADSRHSSVAVPAPPDSGFAPCSSSP